MVFVVLFWAALLLLVYTLPGVPFGLNGPRQVATSASTSGRNNAQREHDHCGAQ